MSDALTDVEVIALSAGPPAVGDAAGVSRVRTDGMPIATGKMSGVVLTGRGSDVHLEEAARAVRPTGRLLVDPSPADAVARLSAVGLRVLAQEGSVLLAVRG